MGIYESPSTPLHELYPQALQLKLYQAFIFSIPILFSIILFLLFYLFYLKRRASTNFSSAATLPRSSTQAIIHDHVVDIKGILKNKLPVILFDEDSMMKDSQCCVCLGEFEIKEELHQLPSCKHIFHVECIRHWLRANFSCPLCRSHVIITSKNPQPVAVVGPEVRVTVEDNNPNNSRREEHVVMVIDGSSSASSSSSTEMNKNL